MVFSLWKVSFPTERAFFSFSKFFVKIGKFTLHSKKEVSLEKSIGSTRKSPGVSQEELAAALEVSRQTIGSLEHGRYNPSIILAFKLARYFNTTIEDIFIYEEDAT